MSVDILVKYGTSLYLNLGVILQKYKLLILTSEFCYTANACNSPSKNYSLLYFNIDFEDF